VSYGGCQGRSLVETNKPFFGTSRRIRELHADRFRESYRPLGSGKHRHRDGDLRTPEGARRARGTQEDLWSDWRVDPRGGQGKIDFTDRQSSGSARSTGGPCCRGHSGGRRIARWA